MIGKRYWIVIWWGILALGVIGLIGAIHWSIKTHWRNLEEVLRGVGTVLVSVGMLLLLHHTGGGAGQTLMLAALIAFILAFAVGRDRKPRGSDPDDVDDAQNTEPKAQSPKPDDFPPDITPNP